MLDIFARAADDWAETKGTAVTRIAKGPTSEEPVALLAEYHHSGHKYEFLGAIYKDPCALYVKPFGQSWTQY